MRIVSDVFFILTIKNVMNLVISKLISTHPLKNNLV